MCSKTSASMCLKANRWCCSARPAVARTTILRIIAGLELPDSGYVILHGQDVTDLPARERGVGVIFQSYALFPA